MEQTNTLRKSRRVATDCRLEFIGEDEVDGVAEMLDVSFTGCMARSEHVMPPGFRLRLSLFLTDGLEWPVRVDEAVVRWARGGEVGIEFVVMRPPQLHRIQQFVIKHRPVS
ncbi:MAG: PilZ domain-containing protein [Nitrospira sp.]|uniref:PilZ domain-containing protein n=1 Tax=Nitrospira defluvii TaxID=330214 RepID=A0ABN7M6V3_9BACT|nr:PilZ domain-containing protein [Nitrospira defluvii]MCS6329127.1 PilZ domain-containing protein [Nitrospira sp.]CAE6788824.1 hypothetical protein NSPZN2_50243 [Nitrospira defluvii]